MTTSYIPSREDALDTWLENFKTLIASSPTTYGLQAADATAITSAYNNWHTAFLAATNPTTRTRGTVEAKNAQKVIVLGVARGYAATIRANSAVSGLLKIGLGLHVRDTAPTPVPPPATAPRISFAGMRPGLQDITATDETTPGRRGKPPGSAGLLLFRAVGPTPATEAMQATFLSFVTRTEYSAAFDPADNGKIATYFARWTNSKGQVGPWSMAASMPIAA